MLTRYRSKKNTLEVVLFCIYPAVVGMAIHACSPQKTAKDPTEAPTQPPSQVVASGSTQNPQPPAPEVLPPVSSDGGAMVPQPPPPQVEAEPDGLALYDKLCASCHGPVAQTSIKDGTVEGIKAALQNQPLMRNVVVSESEIVKISEILRAM